jgi:surface antigen
LTNNHHLAQALNQYRTPTFHHSATTTTLNMKALSIFLCALLASVSMALPQRFNRDDLTELDSAHPSSRPSFDTSKTSQPKFGRPEFEDNEHNDNDFDGQARHDLESNDHGNTRPKTSFPSNGNADVDDSTPAFPPPHDDQDSSPVHPSESSSFPEPNRSAASDQGNGDDYPYKGQCSSLDKWKFNNCQCTSFVAWRLNDAGGVPFNNRYKNQFWGNANNWDSAARNAGLIVDNNPTVGSIAQSDAGGYGHVAWVSKVASDQVTIEEYNFNGNRAYHTRTVRKDKFKYIHFA